MDVGFVLDASGSITGTPSWDSVIAFTKRFVQTFRVGDEFLNFGVIYFKTGAELLFNVSEFNQKTTMLEKIDDLNMVPRGGDTNIAAGLRMLHSELYSSKQVSV